MVKGEKIDNYIVREDDIILSVMQIIEKNSGGVVFCVDNSGALKGSITDGDIRRWMIKTGDASAFVGQVMFRDVLFLFDNERDRAINIVNEKKIMAIPIIDLNHRIVDIIWGGDRQESLTDKGTKQPLSDIPVIIMAGGKGTRLYPYTKILPKPLIPIGDIPILERIICEFRRFGARKIYITVNYKKEIIKAYLTELGLSEEIVFVEEERPLGTAGSIRLVRDVSDGTVLISNCDILIDVDYRKLVGYHTQKDNDITIVSSQKNISIPYGVIHPDDDGMVKQMEEKPQISRFVNTGMYMMKAEYIQWIPKGKPFNMTDLVDKLLEQGKRVGMYPVGELSFLDMGEFEEMKKMEKRFGGRLSET